LILTLDPGAASGVALWDHTGRLLAAAVLKPEQVLPWVVDFAPVTVLVHERPQIYQRGKSKGDPNKLLDLYGQACTLAGEMHVRRVELLPAEWKGQLPKDVHHARILAGITPEERERIPHCRISAKNPHGIDHNILDAIGLGLFHFSRQGRGGTPLTTKATP
jgi:hypothetical protein